MGVPFPGRVRSGIPKRVFSDSGAHSFQTPRCPLAGDPGRLFPDSVQTLSWFWAGPARETLCGAGGLESLSPGPGEAGGSWRIMQIMDLKVPDLA